MPPPVTLLLGFHCHQPVDNCGWVIRQAFERAYQPFVAHLERHPRVKVALHYTGCLLEWLEVEEPAFLKRLACLVKAGQVELLGGGYYEPILPLIPERDRQGQLAWLSEKVQALCGQRPAGVWLAERVWEPELPATLAQAGFDYTIVDDTHIRAALPPTMSRPEDIHGFYLTEHEGWTLRLFPSSKRLRYIIPFHRVEETIAFLRACAPGTIVTFADDGEKFGFWPGTSQWVYEEGWLEQFLQALEANADWLTTTTFRECAAERRPSGYVYLSCLSYDEMLEWSGGHFRNFLVKYPEANLMHKRMLDVSGRLAHAAEQRARPTGLVAVNGHRMRTREVLTLARRELYQAQCNCGYWHGVFGGLYLGHLRDSIYHHLIQAERWLEALEPRRHRALRVHVSDVDLDGQEEVTITTPTTQLILSPHRGGALIEWDLRELALNVINTLMRRPEPYHAVLRRGTKVPLLTALTGGAAKEQPKTIHDVLGVKEAGLQTFLMYDRYPRWSGLVHLLPERPSVEALQRGDISALDDPLRPLQSQPVVGGELPRTEELVIAFRGQGDVTVPSPQGTQTLHLQQELAVSPHQPQLCWRVTLTHTAGAPWRGWVGIEWNVSLRDPERLQPSAVADTTALTVEDRDRALRLCGAAEQPGDVLTLPIETVSGSEEGLERTYQGLCVWWGRSVVCQEGAPVSLAWTWWAERA